MYIERFIHDADKSKLHDFLLSEKLTENLVYGYAEQDIVYRRIESEKSYIKMKKIIEKVRGYNEREI